uniref:Formin-like protein n=1 Tax=Lilium longiflorum TaxID=4690 RepID=A0A1Q1NIF5_LILLO|nr:FH1 [Lilium longiflorum]
MGLRRNAMVVILCVMFSHLGSEGRVGRDGLFLGWRDSSSRDSVIGDEGLVEQMWINCSLHLMNYDEFSLLNYIIHDSQEINRRSRLLLEGSTEEALTLISPEIKKKFMDCWSKQKFSFHVTVVDDMRKIFTEFIESLLGWNLVPRRHLTDIRMPMAPAFAPSFTSAPFALSLLSLSEAPSLSPGTDPPSYSPAPSSVLSPASTPAPESESVPADSLLTPPPVSLHPKKHHDLSSVTSPVLASKKQMSIEIPIVVAVVVTASVVSLVAAFIAFCCLRRARRKDNLGHGQVDDENFVVLSDLYGASQKPSGKGHAVNKNGASASKKRSSQHTKSNESPSGDSDSSTEQSDAQESKLPLPPGMLPLEKAARPRPVPPPPPPNVKPSPPVPPPPKCASPPRPPPGARVYRPSPLGPKKSANAAPSEEVGTDTDTNAPKTKLKPFFWDKVQANTDQSMVWDQLKAGSFQFNEEMIESLFGYDIDKQKSVGKKETSKEPAIQYVQLLEPKKSQNLAISLKAMNVKSEEVCDALMEGNELPTELLQTLLRMVPSTDEELKLRLYNGDHSLLGPAEQFLKTLVDIPFAFQRMDALLFMSSLQEEVSSTKESFSTLELACKEVRNSRLFLKLLEAVLKTGNRMNDGTYRGDAQAFKLDTLLKLSDVKGTDGKTTLLHFVVQEIIRSEGVRAARARARENGSFSSITDDDLADDSPTETGDYVRSLGLKVVSGVSSELENVKKAASLDADALTSTVANLGQRLVKTKEFMDTSMRSIEGECGFQQSVTAFVEKAEADITSLLEEEKRIRSLVKSTTDYFHGNASSKDEGLRLFVIVRDFLGMIDKVCREVSEMAKRAAKTPRSRDAPNMSPARDAPNMSPARDPRQLLFPAIRDQRIDYSSSDDED